MKHDPLSGRSLLISRRYSKRLRLLFLLLLLNIFQALRVTQVQAGDVIGYSLLKGEFLNQVSATETILDPDFGFALLATVDLADFDLLQSASLRLPEGDSISFDDFGDFWSLLDTYDTYDSLNSAYAWGDYILKFRSVNEGSFSCLLELPETELPPRPALANFADVQAVDPSRGLALTWKFDSPPHSNDFVQVYINLLHWEVFSTPNVGEPGALTGASNSIVVPPDTFAPGETYSLNIEITRPVSTNPDAYPGAEGAAAVFRSTSMDLVVVAPPSLRWLGPPDQGTIALEAAAEPKSVLVLQVSNDLRSWTNTATNQAPTGTNVFTLSLPLESKRFFRVWQQ